MDRNWLVTATEEELKTYLVSRFQESFFINEEVKGVFLVDRTPVRIDYLMFPKPDLIEKGFIRAWFGVEVKSLGSIKNRAKKGIATCWQSITYSQSLFGNVRPIFVLMFPSFDAFTIGRERDGHDRYLMALLQKANVGGIYFQRNKWSIKFAAGIYFSQDRGLGNVKNVGLKRHVGTKK